MTGETEPQTTGRRPSGLVAALRSRLGLDGLPGAGNMMPLVVLFGLNAVDELDRIAFAVLSPEISDAFGLDVGGITALVTVMAFANLLIALPIGFYADRANRIRVARVGASVWGVFSAFTAFVPSVGWLGLSRVGAGLGRSVNRPTHESLLADYYPPKNRPGVYAVHNMANSVGQIVGPLAAGLLATLFGWRVPFVVLVVPTVFFVLLSLRLKEPTRGYHERIERGADEALATVEEAPPSWEESWRMIGGVKTLRRIWAAYPFLIGGLLGIGVLRNLFYDEVFGVGPAQRGVLEAIVEPGQILGLLIGIPIATRMLRRDPSRVFPFTAAAATGAACAYVGFALSPNLPMAVAFAMTSAFFISVVPPGLNALVSLLLPPRARSFGFVVTNLYILPGLLCVLVAGRIGDSMGMRAGMLAMVPVFLIGAYIMATAGSKVAKDIQSVQKQALAQAESRQARDEGAAKLLVCRGVDVAYGQVQVLFDVDFDVADGEIVALLGTNGAGKSTLLKAISGLVDPAAGAIVLDGTDATFAPPPQLLRRGVVYMPGGKAVFPTLTVAENLGASAWQRRDDVAGLATDIEGVLERFPRLRERYEQPAGNLSGGEQQMLGLSMALLAKPRLLMIDELSLGLAPTIVAQLLELVREIHAAGTTVILVEQSINVALELAERAVFMEKGEVRFEGRTADLMGRDDILRSVFLEGAGSNLGASSTTTPSTTPPSVAAPAPGPTVATRRPKGGSPVLVVEGVAKRYGGIAAVDDVSLSVAPGEILGLIGPNGAGKTTLFDLISGFVPTDAGAVRLDGVDVSAWSPNRRHRAGMGRSFQDAMLFPSMTVREALAMGFDRHLRHRDALSAITLLPDAVVEQHLVAERVDDLLELLGLQAFADKFVAELSTGSRRIVDIGCAIAHAPTVLLLDEPSSGIAQRETEALGPLLSRIQDLTGTSLLIIEHDMPLITGLSDRLIALDQGAIIAEGTPRQVIAHPEVVASYLGTDDATINRSGTATIA